MNTVANDKGKFGYPLGSLGIVPDDKDMPYPRVCAHRGFNTVAPENTMPAFAAAISLGAEEIEFDIWSTKDGELVTAHDARLERVSNGEGFIGRYTLEELKKLDFGSRFSEKLCGLQLPTFEEILQQFAGRVIMNIHMKIWDVLDDTENKTDPRYEQVAALIKKYNCEKHIYFMSTHTESLLEMRKLLPDASYCQGSQHGQEGNKKMVELAIEHGFDKVQFVFWRPFEKDLIDLAHAHGIKCNYCQADDGETARKHIEMGIDTIMTNDFHIVRESIKEFLPSKSEL